MNDEPLRLVTRSPSVTVVDGWRAVISRAHLLTTDSDTPPDQLRYDVIVPPEVGRLRIGDRRRTVTSFTQADVDDGRVEFVHSQGTGPGFFVFQVGRHGHS